MIEIELKEHNEEEKISYEIEDCLEREEEVEIAEQ